MFDFIDIQLIDVIDIILVALLVYYVYKLIRGTAAISIFSGIILIYIVWIIVNALKMSLMSAIINQVLGVGMIALIILFQQEIRRFLLHLGNKYVSGGHAKVINRVLGRQQETMALKALDEITQACRKMSDTKTGALIVIAHTSSLEAIIETGDIIDANINRRLIENIFFKNSPLHDGAMVIANNRIVAARCTLPVSENPNIPAQYGMRHKAAAGMTETTDAAVIVVSEETGNISFVRGGQIKKINSITELRLAIENSYKTV
ncbi:MAG: diadenylate cyclase CdaA [Bacteroidales bacterium]|nr:diadenylate cyclase CdaA [Bacteroidales bacterium]